MAKIKVICTNCNWSGERSANMIGFGCPKCRRIIVRVESPAQEQPLVDLERLEDIPDGRKSERVKKLEMLEQAAQLGLVTREPQIIKKLLRRTTAELKETLLRIETRLEALKKSAQDDNAQGSVERLAGAVEGVGVSAVAATRAAERLAAAAFPDPESQEMLDNLGRKFQPAE